MTRYTPEEAYVAIKSLLAEQDALIEEHRAVARTVTPNSSTDEIRRATERLNDLYQKHQSIAAEIRQIRANTGSGSIN